MEVLRWIGGSEGKNLLYLADEGRVGFRAGFLAFNAGADKLSRRQACAVIVDYISSNEGLLLLTQITQGRHKYLLHIGSAAPVLVGRDQVIGALNLDDNFDSRINPRRRGGQKTASERPPRGFDSLVAANPGAQWLSVRTGQVVPLESIILHELAEAHGKVALGLDYMSLGGRPGAHELATERELKFGRQRAFDSKALTVGLVQVVTPNKRQRNKRNTPGNTTRGQVQF
jgi:hypothetical protein